MTSTDQDDSTAIPPFLTEIAEHLQKTMPDAWQWAASEDFAHQDIEAIRLDLLRTTIRLDRESNRRVYDLADQVVDKLHLNVPVTLYQLQNPINWNAAAVPLPAHAHLLFEGPLLRELGDSELTAVLAHELGHFLLWQIDDGKYRITFRLLDALTDDSSVDSTHLESSRLARLYSEVFCDRVAQNVVSDPIVVISSLLKIGTQSSDVDGSAYLQQAAEILSSNDNASEDATHPELFIRARALQLWADQVPDADQAIAAMIQGQPKLDALDLLSQANLATMTRKILDCVFQHRWLRTDAAIAHAKLFFDDYEPSEWTQEQLANLAEEVALSDASIQDYVAYILLDFATTDRDHENLPLAVAMDLAERFSLVEKFHDLAKKELRLRVKQLRDLNQNKREMLEQAGAE
ncbi:MAG: M48 family metalloprotease [Pirellulaceae bacterium]|nr:M48 family metalloprotease [Pirellulaceae bacterium]